MKFAGYVALGVGLVVFSSPQILDAALTELLFELRPVDDQQDDRFGEAVALSGTTAIIGAPYRQEGFVSLAGGAYLFDVRTGSQIFKLTRSLGTTHAVGYGGAVAIDENIAIVGASGAFDVASVRTGAAYIFDVNTGGQRLELKASDGKDSDFFGIAVGVSGGTAIVGAPGQGDDEGAAYLYDVGAGNELLKLTPSDASLNSQFGRSVAISGKVAIVGAPERARGTGAAYLFDVDTGTQLFKLTASDGMRSDTFGLSVGISGKVAIVGAPGHRLTTGAAYLFDVMTGELLSKLSASDASAYDLFGVSVGVSGNIAVVGAFANDDAGEASGAAYLFDVSKGDELVKLIPSDAAPHDKFGISVAISGTASIIGAPAPLRSGGSGIGSAYLFHVVPEPDTSDLLICGVVLGFGFGQRQRGGSPSRSRSA